jgi:hypothetical protein
MFRVPIIIGSTYQKNDRDVEHESAKTVQEECEETDVVDIIHGALRNLPDQSNNTVHDSTDRGEVVHGYQGVHLEVSRAEQALDHGKSKCLKDDTTNLVQDSDEDKVNLANRGDDDTDDDGRDIEKLLEVGLGDTEQPAGDEDGNGSGGLEHLDECDRKVKVCQVAADQGQAEEKTNGDDSAEIDATSHLDLLAAIKQGGEVSHKLCHDGREDLVVGREDNGIACIDSSC